MNTETFVEIRLPCGAKTLISKKDEWIKKEFPWWTKVKNHVRCQRNIKTKYGSVKETYYLHRIIVGTKIKGFEIDHINRNGLDNRRENLRLATRGENCANKSKAKRTTSKYRGVCYRPTANKKHPWIAYTARNGKQIYIGYFSSEDEAALAYNKRSKEIWGEFAFQNSIEKKSQILEP